MFFKTPVINCGLIDPVSLAHPTKLWTLQVLNFTQPIDSLGGSIKVFMHYLCVHEFRKLLYILRPAHTSYPRGLLFSHF